MKEQLKHLLGRFYLDRVATEARSIPSRFKSDWKRGFGKLDRQLAESYLGGNGEKKLHIGCGLNPLEGWLNTNFPSGEAGIMHLDATRHFPFPDGVFQYSFSEHVIEHVSYRDGLFMLKECRRVLAPGGRIRVSTPDLPFLLDLYREDKSDLQQRYIEWLSDAVTPHATGRKDTFVINAFVREWGHQFIYDEQVLRSSLELAGFTDVTRCELNQSSDEALRNLEHEKRIPPGFVELETLTLEATVPGGEDPPGSTN